MAEFTANLNPKKSAMDLGDLLKMDEAMTKRSLYDKAIKSKAPNVIVPVNLKSSSDDIGVPFKFGNNYQSSEE